MKRTFVFILILLTIGTGSRLSAQEVDKETLETLYQQIDEAIDKSPQYVAKRREKIAEARKMLLDENNLEKKFALSEELFELYKPYRNDSALHFADLCIAFADSLHRKDMVGLYRSLKARQCSTVGMYVQALDLLKKVDKQALGREELIKYYAAWMHVSGEIGSYSQQQDEKTYYYEIQDGYRDSVLAVAEEGCEEYLHLKVDVLSARRQYQDALAVSDTWISKVNDGTHESAFAAFYRSVVYDKLGNSLQLRYWLGKSALDDIKCAVNDQASLFMLAERLCEDGEYERAYRYVRFCEACNIAFSPQLRNYQVRYVAKVMEAVYQNNQDYYSRLLIYVCLGAVLLIVVLLLCFRFYCKKQSKR